MADPRSLLLFALAHLLRHLDAWIVTLPTSWDPPAELRAAFENFLKELIYYFIPAFAPLRPATIALRPPAPTTAGPSTPARVPSVIDLTATTPQVKCAHCERPALHSCVATTKREPTPRLRAHCRNHRPSGCPLPASSSQELE